MMVKVYFMMIKGRSFYEGPFLSMSTFGLLRNIPGAFVVGNQIKHGGRELDLANTRAKRLRMRKVSQQESLFLS